MKILSRIAYGLCIIIGMVFCLTANPTFASATSALPESEVKLILKKIKDREMGLQTFIAKMQQTKKTQMFKDLLHSEGVIYFDHAGKLLLKMTQPSLVFIFFKGDHLYIHYPDYRKTEETYIGSNVFERYFGLGESIDEFYEQYSIEVFSGNRPDHYHLKMAPKEDRMSKRIEMIDVMIHKTDFLPDQIRILEKDGDDTSIALEFISINQPLPKGIFDIDLGDTSQFNQ